MNTVREKPLVEGTSSGDESYRVVAIRRLKKRRDFRSHLFGYLVVNAALWTIWAVDGAINEFGWPWPAIVTFFWGLFVLGDASETFWKKPITEAEIDREVERLRGRARELRS